MYVLGIWLGVFSAVLRSQSLPRSGVEIILDNHLAEAPHLHNRHHRMVPCIPCRHDCQPALCCFSLDRRGGVAGLFEDTWGSSRGPQKACFRLFLKLTSSASFCPAPSSSPNMELKGVPRGIFLQNSPFPAVGTHGQHSPASFREIACDSNRGWKWPLSWTLLAGEDRKKNHGGMCCPPQPSSYPRMG